MFDPKKFNTEEYVRQIVRAVQEASPTLVGILLEEYGAKAYRLGQTELSHEVVKLAHS